MDLGFYIIDCDNSAKNSFLIDIINNIISFRPYDSIVLFNHKYSRIDTNKKFPIFHISQAKYFRGNLIYFDVKSATLAKTFPSPSKQILCCDYPEWSTNKSARSILWKSIYEDPNLKIITYEQNIKNLIEICWDKKVLHIPELNARNLYDAIEKI